MTAAPLEELTGERLREYLAGELTRTRGRSAGLTDPPRYSRSCTLRPTPVAQWNSRALTPPASSTLDVATVWIFSKMRGTDGRSVGCTSLISSRIFFGSPRQYASGAPRASASIWTARVSTCASGRNT